MSTDKEFPGAVYALLERLASSSESVAVSALSQEEREAWAICQNHRLTEWTWAYPPNSDPTKNSPLPPTSAFRVLSMTAAGWSALAENRLAGPAVAYLGITLDDRNRTARRQGFPMAAQFKRNDQPWKLFAFLVEAGPDGMKKDLLLERLDMQDKTEDALRGHKKKADEFINSTLRVSIESDGYGVWRIKPLDGVS